MDDFFEQVGIGGRIAGIEYGFVQWNIIMAQNVLYIAAGEVDPVDFRFIAGEIFVVLLLTGLKRTICSALTIRSSP